MSIGIEKSGIKLKIPPDDYVKSERSKASKSKKKKQEPKPNLQKEQLIYCASYCTIERSKLRGYFKKLIMS